MIVMTHVNLSWSCKVVQCMRDSDNSLSLHCLLICNLRTHFAMLAMSFCMHNKVLASIEMCMVTRDM